MSHSALRVASNERGGVHVRLGGGSIRGWGGGVKGLLVSDFYQPSS